MKIKFIVNSYNSASCAEHELTNELQNDQIPLKTCDKVQNNNQVGGVLISFLWNQIP